uniref:Cadherin-20 n=1 Tax=Neogobius melanostomus TaxID=47308 RepID=A0A8C6WI83_9GOBI
MGVRIKRRVAALVLALLALLPLGMLGRPSEGEEGEDKMAASVLRRRVKRGWVWNQFFVLEEYMGLEPLYIGKLHSDMDKGDGSIRYILMGEGAGTTFTIDDSTGDIHAIQRLDREFKSQYVLRAQARNRLTDRPLEPESEFIVKIQDINDNEPLLILLMLSLRTHRKKPYLCDQEENVHENIVRYDDEGGGEEDTEAFDIAAMWNPREVHPPGHASSCGKLRQDMLPEIQSLSRYVPQARVVGGDSSNVHGYVLAKLLEADVDPCAPPYDSLQTYAYEGEGSVAESLSSLQSGASNADHEYDYLNDWGPRFKKLAEMYGVLETQSSSPSGRRRN